MINTWEYLTPFERQEIARTAARYRLYSEEEIAKSYNEYATLKNKYDGYSQPSQQMQIGKGYWQQQASTPTHLEQLAEFNRQREAEEQRKSQLKQQRRAAARQKILEEGRSAVEQRLRDNSVESNDNLWIEQPLTYKRKNPHLSQRAVEGAKSHAAWEQEHPNLTAWGNVLGAVPFAVATTPAVAGGLVPLADAAAATTTGQAITAGLAPLMTATNTSIAGAPAMAWVDAGLTSLAGAHGIQTAIDEGGVSPTTALEMAPLGRLEEPIYTLGKRGVAAGDNLLTTYKEIKPEINNWVADKIGLPELKGLVNSKGQYYESRFNPFKNRTLEEHLLSEGYSPIKRYGSDLMIDVNTNTPVKTYSLKNNNTGIVETVKVNPFVGGRLHQYNVTASNPEGIDLGSANIRRMSYGYKAPGSYKMGNEFDLALTAGDVPTVDKNVLRTFGKGISKYSTKGTRITGDGNTSIADDVIFDLLHRNYRKALSTAAKRPMLPTNNALSTDSYRYLVGYGNKYPNFTTTYDGLDAGFNSAGVKYSTDKQLFKESPLLLEGVYKELDADYPGLINGMLPHPWIVRK